MTNYQPATLATYALREMQNEYVSRRIEYGKPAVGRLNHLGCFEKLPARGPRFLKLGKVPLAPDTSDSQRCGELHFGTAQKSRLPGFA